MRHLIQINLEKLGVDLAKRKNINIISIKKVCILLEPFSVLENHEFFTIFSTTFKLKFFYFSLRTTVRSSQKVFKNSDHCHLVVCHILIGLVQSN